MEPDSKRRYCHYKKNNKKQRCQSLETEFDEEAKFKLERFMDDVRQFSERSKKRKEKQEAEASSAKQIAVQKGFYENAVLGKPSYVSVKEILNGKYKGRAGAVQESAAGGEKAVSPPPPQPTGSPELQTYSSSQKTGTSPVMTNRIAADRSLPAANSRCTLSDSSSSVSRKRNVEGGRAVGDNKQRRVQEAVALATEKMVSRIVDIKETKPRYPDYESIVKKKILEICERRFMGEMRKSACSAVDGFAPEASSQATPPPSETLQCPSPVDRVGGQGDENPVQPLGINLFGGQPPPSRRGRGGNFFDDGLWGNKRSPTAARSWENNAWTTPQAIPPRVTPPRITPLRVTSPRITSPVISPPRISSPVITPPRITSLRVTGIVGPSPPPRIKSNAGMITPPGVVFLGGCMPPVGGMGARLMSPIAPSPCYSPPSQTLRFRRQLCYDDTTTVHPTITPGVGWPSPLPDSPPSYLRLGSPPHLRPTSPRPTSPVSRMNHAFQQSRKRSRRDYTEDYDRKFISVTNALGLVTRRRPSGVFSPHTFS